MTTPDLPSNWLCYYRQLKDLEPDRFFCVHLREGHLLSLLLAALESGRFGEAVELHGRLAERLQPSHLSGAPRLPARPASPADRGRDPRSLEG